MNPMTSKQCLKSNLMTCSKCHPSKEEDPLSPPSTNFRNLYHTFCNVRTALRNMIINNIEEICISAFCHPITRFNTCTPLTLMEHIWITYGKITTSDLTTNEERMYTNWNPPTPIETLYEQLTDGQQFAMQEGETIHNLQLVRKSLEEPDYSQKTVKNGGKNQKTKKHSIILNNSSQLLMMIAARTMRLPEVPATARIQSNKSSTIK